MLYILADIPDFRIIDRRPIARYVEAYPDVLF
jgi:hypothetical protein